MSDLTVTQATVQTPAEYEAILSRIFSEIDVLNQQMQEDRKEIDRLRADSAAIEAETRSILSRLKAMV